MYKIKDIYIHTIEQFLIRKKDDLMSFSGKKNICNWREIVMLSNLSQSQKIVIYFLSFVVLDFI